MYMDLHIPDEMLASFAARYPIDLLLSGDHGTRTLLRYKRRDQTWLATVDQYYHEPQRGGRQLTIRLSHDGFRYHHRKHVAANLTTHKRRDWFALGSDILDDMPFIAQLKTDLEAQLVVYYNIKHKRMDIHFLKQESETPFLLITFEPGNPVSDVSRELRF